MANTDEKIRIGGLMRCCTQTIYEARANQSTPAKEGDRIKCKWGSTWMIFRNGAWEWDHQREESR